MADKLINATTDPLTQTGILQRFRDQGDGTFVQIFGAFLSALISGEDQVANRLLVEQRNSATYISTAATTTAKTGAGLLHAITVEGGTAGTIIVYDNTAGSGAIIASFDSTNAQATYIFDVQFATGLTIVTGGATKLTVSWR